MSLRIKFIGVLATLLAFLLSYSDVSHAVGASSTWLYDACKQLERQDEGGQLSNSEKVGVIECGNYVNGAFDAYNYSRGGKCRFDKYSGLDLIRMYVHAYRSELGISKSTSAAVLMSSVVATCICNENPMLQERMCPLERVQSGGT